MSIVSSIVTLETQKNPGIVASRILAIKAFLGPYILLQNSNTTQRASTAKVTETNLPATAVMPKICKYPVVIRSKSGG